MATTEERAGDAMDVDVSPKNKTTVEHDIRQSLGSISNSVESLEMRADPDAQATVTDFLDFTEYLPSDMMRSLTLIGKLDQTYSEASLNVHNLTSTWGKLPSLPADERPSPTQLRADISSSLNHAVSSRVYSHAEAVRMSENVNRHYNRANAILAKLKNMMENYPAEEQKSPVATSKSPQMVRAPKMMRTGNGEKVRRPRIPRITVPGEVLPPYDQFVAYSDDSDESSSSSDEESLPPTRSTPAPRIKVVKTPKARPPKTPKAPASRPPKVHTVPATPAAALQPPPENAVIGSTDAPWLQLTPWELARLRKRMKKNATWNPSDTMILRELKTLGRGIDAYKEAKKKAEDEGRTFDQVPPALAPDAGSENKPIPEGAISAAALASDDIQLSNRGMKLNEAKKLKRESLAKQAAEEAEESARQFREAARLLMSSDKPPAPSVANNEQTKAAPKSSSRSRAKANGNKRKRDSIPEAEAEKPEVVETPAPRPAPKRTKTETPVPLPNLRANLASQPLTETPIPPPVLTPGGSAATPKMTTPVPIPVPGQEHAPGTNTAPKPANTSAPASSPTGSVVQAGPPPAPIPANIVTKPPAETPIPPPVLSPKKSTTPILPPVRDPGTRRETRGEAKKTQQQVDPPTSVPQPQLPLVHRSSSAAPSIKQSSSRAATPGTTPVPESRRPSSRGKASSQEPQPSLAAERPRRTSTARNTPVPEIRQPSKRTRKPAPGIVSKTNAGGSSAASKRKAAPKKKRTQKKEKGQPIEIELEEDDEGNPIDPDEPRYCDCNRVSFGDMIACDNENCDKEWFHLECVGMAQIPARTTKWYCPDCRVRLNIGEKDTSVGALKHIHGHHRYTRCCLAGGVNLLIYQWHLPWDASPAPSAVADAHRRLAALGFDLKPAAAARDTRLIETHPSQTPFSCYFYFQTMGINGFWEVIKDTGVDTSLARWAAEHIKEHRRPLRIAIDEAHWRYKAITVEAFEEIKRRTPPARPRELNMLDRIWSLMHIGIEIIFVFDGEGRPDVKRDKKTEDSTERKAREENSGFFKETLTKLHIPWRQAPGEAEAECAALQRLGLVDAVWSEDSDTLMFGCTVLVKNLLKSNGQKSKDEAKVYRLRDIEQKTRITANGIVLYAMVAGCDYTKGLHGCGIEEARCPQGMLVLNGFPTGKEADRAVVGKRLEIVRSVILDAVLGWGMSDEEFLEWRKGPEKASAGNGKPAAKKTKF
ncbi:phd finger domain-containing protein [Colletotrichum chrysophilum]|uniref:Phd finger domain-containing protein n=1 Tax=Colletotrichum chrysophilum TaxID=1836956 RepID=A0AAD9A0D8_9PEZI|nr:phd finger domain-containing protein [Colletotrichum chrysophilum]